MLRERMPLRLLFHGLLKPVSQSCLCWLRKTAKMELSHNAVCHVFTMLSIARLRSEAFLSCQVLLSAHDGETGISEI